MERPQGQSLALLSVTDKSGLVEFARGLVGLGYKLLSTGGTAKLLRESDVPVTDVAEYTGSPEILGGRVKTLHPKVHGGILYDRANPEHTRQVFQGGITAIDLVVVNLYQFREEAVAKALSAEDAIEHIDIGGPTMLRAAAKNWTHVTPVIDPADYAAVLASLRAGGLDRSLRRRLAAKTFATISAYDRMIADYLMEGVTPDAAADASALPARLGLALESVQPLRYGENPHQKAGLYAPTGPRSGFADLQLLQGKELSYNNILDLDAACALVSELDDTTAIIVKHTNPCGGATAADATLETVFKRALACDPKSAFGGIIAVNRPIDRAAAVAMTSLFTECIAAPDFTPEALEVLRAKPNLRVLRAAFTTRADAPARAAELAVRSVRGGLLVQSADTGSFVAAAWRPVTTKAPSPDQLRDLRFAMIVAKHVKSNAIVFVRDGVTVGIGAGQMSRIDAANIAVAKALSEGREVAGSAMASDAFFPFGDTVEFAANNGVTAIVQPGGSKKDQDSIDAANAAGIAMVFSGERHFRH